MSREEERRRRAVRRSATLAESARASLSFPLCYCHSKRIIVASRSLIWEELHFFYSSSRLVRSMVSVLKLVRGKITRVLLAAVSATPAASSRARFINGSSAISEPLRRVWWKTDSRQLAACYMVHCPGRTWSPRGRYIQAIKCMDTIVKLSTKVRLPKPNSLAKA